MIVWSGVGTSPGIGPLTNRSDFARSGIAEAGKSSANEGVEFNAFVVVMRDQVASSSLCSNICEPDGPTCVAL